VALDAEELAAWDEPGALAEVRGRFVNDETDAAVVKQAFYSGDADSAGGEAAYGDFEDVETGEVFAPPPPPPLVLSGHAASLTPY
jgi:hypothetical protein